MEKELDEIISNEYISSNSPDFERLSLEEQVSIFKDEKIISDVIDQAQRNVAKITSKEKLKEAIHSLLTKSFASNVKFGVYELNGFTQTDKELKPTQLVNIGSNTDLEEIITFNKNTMLEYVLQNKIILTSSKKSYIKQELETDNITSSQNYLAIPLQDNNGAPIGIFELSNGPKFKPKIKRLVKTVEFLVKDYITRTKKYDLDSLTGIYTREKLKELLTNETRINQENEQRHEKLYVGLFDIDKFKDFNDIYGHQVGDAVLKEVSNKFKASLRKSDEIGRWGGEEFMFYIKSTPKNMPKTMKRLRKTIEALDLSQYGVKKPVTITLGLTKYNGQNIELLTQEADEAVYVGKKQRSRNIVVLNQGSKFHGLNQFKTIDKGIELYNSPDLIYNS